MIKKIFMFSSIALLAACGGSDEQGEEVNSDSTAVATDSVEVIEEGPILIEGEDKGDYTLYGYESIDAEGNETDVTGMLATLESNGGFEGKVKVAINEVCQKAGCWITFQDAEGNDIRVFFKDHFTIPIETVAGTQAILKGRTVNDTLDVAFQKHLLDDAKEAGQKVAQSEYDAITEDKIETTFECDAILVAKQ